VRVIEYYKDYSEKSKSYIKELAGEMDIQPEGLGEKKRVDPNVCPI
jgi:hypothetical protein